MRTIAISLVNSGREAYSLGTGAAKQWHVEPMAFYVPEGGDHDVHLCQFVGQHIEMRIRDCTKRGILRRKPRTYNNECAMYSVLTAEEMILK